MNEHPSFLVYQHLGPFLKSRGLEVSGGSLDTPRDRFTTELDHIGYFRLDATGGGTGTGTGTTVILVLSLRGKYTDHGPQLRGLISSLNSEDFAREGRLAEIIVVAPEEVMKKKNMTDVVADFRAAAGKPEALAKDYNMYPYHVFSLDIPRAQCVPTHEIADAAEVRAYLARERLSLADLRRVAASNPPVIWIGARPGQVVRIHAPSETAGESYDYCLVSRG